MSVLFESTRIRNLTLANRFVRSATWEGMAGDDGSVTPRLVEVADRLAEGGTGLIITGHAYVSPEGQAGGWQLGVCSDDQIQGLAGMVKSVHDRGSRIAAQLAHAGARAAHRLTGIEPIGPSVLEAETGAIGREMTGDDIGRVIAAFTAAALRARTAGFDAVQIHGAHGYLLSQFLSPYFNKRKDNYGGSIENRSRLAAEVVRAVRDAVGPGFPILIKINSEDFLVGGLTVGDMIEASMVLEKAGVDAIEMSGGTFLSGKYMASRPGKPARGEPEAYYEAAAGQFKEKVKVPLMLVGGVRSFETAERLVVERLADYIALCRPLIREPGLVNRWKSGDLRPAACVSDNGCFKPGFEGKGVTCVVEARLRSVL